MKLENKLILKTTKDFSKRQIPTAIFFGIVAIGMIIFFVILDYFGVGGNKPGVVPIYFKVFILIINIGGLHTIYSAYKSWHQACYTIEIDGDILPGWNLFEKEIKINLNEIKAIKRYKDFYRFYLIDKKDNNFIIVGDMDYYGFLMDYILENYSKNADVEWEVVEKFRKRVKFWKYTKTNPFQTRYGVEYIRWLEDVVEKQRKEMVNKGILEDGVVYGVSHWKSTCQAFMEVGKV